MENERAQASGGMFIFLYVQRTNWPTIWPRSSRGIDVIVGWDDTDGGEISSRGPPSSWGVMAKM